MKSSQSDINRFESRDPISLFEKHFKFQDLGRGFAKQKSRQIDKIDNTSDAMNESVNGTDSNSLIQTLDIKIDPNRRNLSPHTGFEIAEI